MDALDLTFLLKGTWRPAECNVCIARIAPNTDCNDVAALFDSTVFTSEPVGENQPVVTGPIPLEVLCGGDTHEALCVYAWDPVANQLVGFVKASVRELTELCSREEWLDLRARRLILKGQAPEMPAGCPPAKDVFKLLKSRVNVADNRKGLFTYSNTFVGSDLLDTIGVYTASCNCITS